MSTSNRYQFFSAVTLDQKTEEQITSFLADCQGFHYFQSPYFFRVSEVSKRLTPLYLIAKDEDEVCGVILLIRQVQSTLPILSFLSSRLIIWGGPVVKDNSPEILEGLLRYYLTHHPIAIYTQIRNLTDTEPYKNSFIRAGFQYEEHLNILVNLIHSEEDLWKDVVTKRRNQIRRAEKEGCTVQQQVALPTLRTCYAILQEVYRRTKIPLPDFSHFESLWALSNERAGLRIFTVSWEGQIIGCMLCLAYGDWLFDYYAGAFSNYYKKFPNDLLPWAVFKWAKQNGFTRFDFGGAGKPGVPYGVRDYKQQFGGELVGYGRYERMHYPRLFRMIKKGYRIWQRYSE
ncbi:lipid II:glycine glycyltransferase FemX [Larkinella bovis]|uniref:Lipid II:glycine glycyltransferase FemX n=1 Tax=Larkinella bovis TaxID=683041 RepID=A0ABW0IL27_9BACT